MLCKNPNCGIYRLTYDPEYDAEKDPDHMPCTFCGELLSMTGADILEGGIGGLVKEKRQAQADYVTTIDQQFSLPRSVTFIEGGTGVGKSYAYLVPTLLELLRDRTARALIVTANKALQAQLIRDFPRILTALGAEEAITYGLLKGRNNYACPYLATEVPPASRRTFEEFTKKLPADIDNWPTDEKMWWWGKVSTDNCPRSGACMENCNNSAARAARVIVTNFHYLGAFLRFPFILLKKGDLRSFKFLVMDEAHQGVSALRSALQSNIAPKFLQNIAGELQKGSLLAIMMDQVPLRDGENFFNQDMIKDLGNLAGRLEHRLQIANNTERPNFSEVPDPLTSEPHKYKFSAVIIDNLPQYLEDLGVTTDLIGNINRAILRLDGLVISRDLIDENPEGCIIRSRVLNRLKRVQTFFQDAYDPSFADTKAAALDPRGLGILPVDVGAIIRPTINTIFKHVVVTSATLAQNGADFTYARSCYGYNQPSDEVVEKVVGSPFDYDRAARLYAPRLPYIPTKGCFYEWYDAISEEIIALATASGGNGFVLFSSAKDLLEVESRTRFQLASAGIPVLTQKEGTSAAALNKDYLATPNAMLYGLRSFWEGVDIQGSKLRLVIIPKLPFPVPDDPIMRTLTARAGANAFMEVTVPIMLETLRQGVGRLIRSKRDMGLIAILDSRFWSGTSNLSRHQATIKNIDYATVKNPKGYGVNICRSLGLKVIDTRSYACNLMGQVKALFEEQTSA